MAISDNNINICSRALVGIGADGISSYEDGTAEAKVASELYETYKQDLLAIYPWSFATCDTYLARLNADDLALYENLFEKPKDWLRTITLTEGRNVTEYTYRAGKINTDAQKPILNYIANVDEADMPAYFVTALIARLQRDFIIPVTGKHDEYKTFDNIYQMALATAKTTDAMSKQPEIIDTSSFIRGRQ